MMLALLRAESDKVIVHGEDVAGEVLFHHVMSLADVPDKLDVLMGRVRLDQLPSWVNDAAIQGVFEHRLLAAVTEAPLAIQRSNGCKHCKCAEASATEVAGRRLKKRCLTIR